MTIFRHPIHRIHKVTDGDTIKVELIQETFEIPLGQPLPEDKWTTKDLGFYTYLINQGDRLILTAKRSCRLHNLDTPEIRGDLHREAGKLVDQLMERWVLEPGQYNSVSAGIDPMYSYRYIGDIQNPSCEWWSQYLEENGLCKPTVKGTRPVWRKEELAMVAERCRALLEKQE